MHISNKMFTIIVLSTLTLIAVETEYKMETIEESFCKKYFSKEENKEINFCMNISLSYPTHRNKYIQNAIHELTANEVKSKIYVLNTIKAGDAGTMGHESSTNIQILSFTEKSFSLEVNAYYYMGGAHGSYHTNLYNFDTKTGLKIPFDSLFIKEYKQVLTEIAEKVYRKQNYITSTDNLSTKLNWFKNKFQLSETIGIGEDGLHFEYNPYEIKAFASGNTSFVVPYDELKSIIDRDSYLAPFIKRKKLAIGEEEIYYFEDVFLAFKVIAKRVSEREIELNIQSLKKWQYGGNKGSVSISFPQIKSYNYSLEKKNNGFDKILEYPVSSLIYNFKEQKSVRSSYELVEGESNLWKDNIPKSMLLKVALIEGSNMLEVNLRAVLMDKNKRVKIPYLGTLGQQGAFNYTIKILVK